MHVGVWVVGVAGWNTFPLLDWFGTLLGPEGTSGWVFFLVAASGLDRLTHLGLVDLFAGWWVWWWLWGWGVVVC